MDNETELKLAIAGDCEAALRYGKLADQARQPKQKRDWTNRGWEAATAAAIKRNRLEALNHAD